MKDKEIIFLDTEFSSLDPYKGEILSIGLVKESGEELYLELTYDGEVDPWVKENIIPNLKNKKVSRDEAKQKIRDFVGKNKSVAMAYVNQFDILYIYKLFTIDDCPFFWMPLDFASILYGLGYDPLEYHERQKDMVKKFGIDSEKYQRHNALDDARLLREVYLKLKRKI
ncbi:MAG: exonuclease domain-containing protein [Patescibacteria group bacterium]|jgi:DNA polymerase III epsilon subunit-like protein